MQPEGPLESAAAPGSWNQLHQVFQNAGADRTDYRAALVAAQRLLSWIVFGGPTGLYFPNQTLTSWNSIWIWNFW